MSGGREWWRRESRARHWMRKRIINAAGGRCVACGRMCNLVHDDPLQATIDHVIPVSLGGRHILGNVQLMCATCNVAKGSTPPEWWSRYEQIEEDA